MVVVVVFLSASEVMSHCLTAYPQPDFATVIDGINRELQQKGVSFLEGRI